MLGVTAHRVLAWALPLALALAVVVAGAGAAQGADDAQLHCGFCFDDPVDDILWMLRLLLGLLP